MKILRAHIWVTVSLRLIFLIKANQMGRGAPNEIPILNPGVFLERQGGSDHYTGAEEHLVVTDTDC